MGLISPLAVHLCLLYQNILTPFNCREEGLAQGRTIGIYPELKHCSAINRILSSRGDGARFEDLALEELARLGMTSSRDPVLLQSFELSSLEYVKDRSGLKLVFLTDRNLTEDDWGRLDRLGLAGGGLEVTVGVKSAPRCGYRQGGPGDPHPRRQGGEGQEQVGPGHGLHTTGTQVLLPLLRGFSYRLLTLILATNAPGTKQRHEGPCLHLQERVDETELGAWPGGSCFLLLYCSSCPLAPSFLL